METTARFGKDHLNLADWRISTTSNQQRYKTDGKKVDFVEYNIHRSGKEATSITLEAPSNIGLPTAADEDVIIALLELARKSKFASDMVHFVPSDLLKAMNLSIAQKNFVRLERSLKRLRAVTITYKLAWYDRKKAAVEPVLITGILSEVKLVLRKGRRKAGAIPDSYVQWTNNFYQSLKDGNLTDLNLDLYFNWDRPGSKHLYRHLNKVWHGGKRPKFYERDLKELACGHLGMVESKDVKRNLHRIVEELESKNYITQIDSTQRYRKVRPGVWRVGFELHPNQYNVKKSGKGDSPTSTQNASNPPTQAIALVTAYHLARFGRAAYTPKKHEIDHATNLMNSHDLTLLTQLVEKVAKTVKHQNKDDMYFGFAIPYFESLAKSYADQKQSRKKQSELNSVKQQDDDNAAIAKRQRLEQRREQLEHWHTLTDEDHQRIRHAAIENATSEFIRQRIIHHNDYKKPSIELLQAMVAESNPSK